MSHTPKNLERLEFLARVVAGECRNLKATDGRLFSGPFTADKAHALDDDVELSERADAFVSRFSRLQDTLGDKLLPELLQALGESRATLVDRLDFAERMEWIDSSEEWMTIRQLRNQMIHEYIEDPEVLATALQTGHEYVPNLLKAAQKMLSELKARAWITAVPSNEQTGTTPPANH
jgi:uncharacterized protein with HEPN domain